jgi:integrase
MVDRTAIVGGDGDCEAQSVAPGAPRGKKKKRASNGEGTFETKRGKLWARLPLPGRPRVLVPPEFRSEKRRRDFVRACLEKVAKGVIAFDSPGLRKKVAPGSLVTVREVMKAWTTGEMLQRYGSVNGLRTLASAKMIACTLEKHALKVKTRGPSAPEFGALPAAHVTTEDVATIMAKHAPGRAQTKQHTYNRLHRLFDLAIFPLRLRPEGSNPVSRYLRPAADEHKLFNFLYPEEVLALLKCAKVPLGFRVLCALAVYGGPRKGSLFALRWKWVDFVNGTISAPRTKNKRPLFFDADPGLMAVLRAWHRFCGEPDGEAPVARSIGSEKGKGHVAGLLRDSLRTAGVTRSSLFPPTTEATADDDARTVDARAADANVEPLRFHDLRATFVTWARAAGKSDEWIERRTGHVEDAMIDRYNRAAAVLADLHYVPFPDISRAIPELAQLSPELSPPPSEGPVPGGTGGEGTAGKHSECEGGDLNPYGNNPASTSS